MLARRWSAYAKNSTSVAADNRFSPILLLKPVHSAQFSSYPLPSADDAIRVVSIIDLFSLDWAEFAPFAKSGVMSAFATVFSEFNLPNATTWFYFSLLLA